MLLLAAAVTIPTEFFTPQSVFTFTGITGATLVVGITLQRAFNFNPRWFALLVAIALCELGVWFSPNAGAGDYLLGVLNGCLVFCTVAGGNQLIASATGQSVAAQPRNWFTPWL